MTIVISISSTIGGSCKTTTSCMFAYLLSASYKVLAIDLCGQCHMTEVFLNATVVPTEKGTICDAFEKGDVVSYIRPITNNLHIIPGDQWISSVPASLYIQGYSTEKIVTSLRDLFDQSKANYDFVVVDTPSTSAEELFNLSLSVSDFAIMTYSPNRIKLIDEWLDNIRNVQERLNLKLRVGGILRTRFNNIEDQHKYQSQEVQRQYPDYCWNSVFPNSPRFANIDIHTIRKTDTDSTFKPIYDELILRLLKTRMGGEA